MGGARLHRPRLRIGAKFSIVLALLVACLITTALVSGFAQTMMKNAALRQYSEHIVNLHRVAVLNAALADIGWTALEVVHTDNVSRRGQLRSGLYDRLIPGGQRRASGPATGTSPPSVRLHHRPGAI